MSPLFLHVKKFKSVIMLNSLLLCFIFLIILNIGDSIGKWTRNTVESLNMQKLSRSWLNQL